MDNITHDELVQAGANWFKKDLKSKVIVSESYGFGGEIPDVIAWKSGYSFLIECKASRSDFLADKKKFYRLNSEYAMGHLRLFLCPTGLIQPEELPDKWGLLYFDGKKVKRVVCWKGNIVDSWGHDHFFTPNHQNEVHLLSSYIRRNL